MKQKKIPLLLRLIIGIVSGVIIGISMKALGWEIPVRFLATFNGLFGNFLSFVVPLLVLSFVAVGIADLGNSAGKLLGLSVGMAYFSTVFFTTLAMLASRAIIFPLVLQQGTSFSALIENPKNFLLSGYFTIGMPPVLDVMSALLLAFILGVGLSTMKSQENALMGGLQTFQTIIEKVIGSIIIPLLPFHIAGVFANMSYGGKALEIMQLMMTLFIVIIGYHSVTLLVHFLIAGGMQKKNPFKLFLTMVPSYITALGTQSSAASIPVSREQMKQAGVSEDVANFTAPLFATIHMPGSAITISTVAFALVYMTGMQVSYLEAIGFILMLGIVMVAAPGVPGGAVMAALGLLELKLGFGEALLGLTIAMHLAQDSFGTACNVTADGALALEVDVSHQKMMNSKNSNS